MTFIVLLTSITIEIREIIIYLKIRPILARGRRVNTVRKGNKLKLTVTAGWIGRDSVHPTLTKPLLEKKNHDLVLPNIRLNPL